MSAISNSLFIQNCCTAQFIFNELSCLLECAVTFQNTIRFISNMNFNACLQ